MPELDYLRMAFAATGNPMLVVEPRSQRVIAANPAFAQWLGVEAAALVGRSWHELGGRQQGSGAFDGLLEMRRGDGGASQLTGSGYRCGDDPNAEWLVVFAVPAEEGTQVAAHERVPVDPLTGLPTRDHFDRRLAECLARVRKHGAPFGAVLFLDLDDFKPVNDRFGHAVGDRVLAAIAARLAGGIRPGDLLSRRGGDEFTLLVDGIHRPDEALHIAERLVRLSREPLVVEGRELSVGVSIGIALVDGSTDDPARIIAAADQAMYLAKRQGGPALSPQGRNA